LHKISVRDRAGVHLGDQNFFQPKGEIASAISDEKRQQTPQRMRPKLPEKGNTAPFAELGLNSRSRREDFEMGNLFL
jgi:hypothetical protein